MKLFAIFFITLLTVSLVSGSCTVSKAGRCAQDFGRNSHRAMGNKKLICHVANDKTGPASCTSYNINPNFCLELVIQRTLSNDLVIKWWFHKRSTSWTMPTDLDPGWRAAREFQACIRDLGECRGMSRSIIDRTVKKIIDYGCKLQSGTTIQKAQMISVLLPSLLLGHYLQSRI